MWFHVKHRGKIAARFVLGSGRTPSEARGLGMDLIVQECHSQSATERRMVAESPSSGDPPPHQHFSRAGKSDPASFRTQRTRLNANVLCAPLPEVYDSSAPNTLHKVPPAPAGANPG